MQSKFVHFAPEQGSYSPDFILPQTQWMQLWGGEIQLSAVHSIHLMHDQDRYSPQLRVPRHHVAVASSQDNLLQVLSGPSVLPLHHFGTQLLLLVRQEGGQHDGQDEGSQQHGAPHQQDAALPRPGRARSERHPGAAEEQRQLRSRRQGKQLCALAPCASPPPAQPRRPPGREGERLG